MKGKDLLLLCIGKVKEDYWRRAVEHYCRLLSRWRKTVIIELKDADGHLPVSERIKIESCRLEANFTPGFLKICLTEYGKFYSSEQFALLIKQWNDYDGRQPCFIIGGPYGFEKDFLKKCDALLSLSAMTLPHEMVRVLLLEQLYRAHSIIAHTGYHH